MLSFVREINNARLLFSVEELWKWILLLLLMVVGGVIEAVGVAAVPMFIAILTQPASLTDMAVVGQYLNDLPDAPTHKLIWISAFILFVFVVARTSS